MQHPSMSWQTLNGSARSIRGKWPYCCRPPFWGVFMLLIHQQLLRSVSNAALECPGIEPSPSSIVCTAACQEATCTGLTQLFFSTNDGRAPQSVTWRKIHGWDSLLTNTCNQTLAVLAGDGTPNYCTWYGVSCCTVALRDMGYCLVVNSVLSLELDINGLNGDIEDPLFQSSIAQLHACGMLDLTLTGNTLSGSLTDFWGGLTNMLSLRLNKNKIRGTLPDGLRNMTRLVALFLDKNPMHGNLPDWIGELQSLQYLSLIALSGYNPDGKRGLVGTIPDSISQLQGLVMLGLRGNSLVGTIPYGVCQTNMIAMDFKGNSLHGDFSQFLRCTNLKYLDISNNKFSGSLPDIPYWGWADMSVLDASNNDFEGTLPAAFYQLSSLMSAALAKNRLTGTISSELQNMDGMMELNLQRNQLTGQIDDAIWNMWCLKSIDVSHNMLTGTLSPAAGNGFFIEAIQLEGNKLVGSIPARLGLPKTLNSVSLENNSLSCSSDAVNVRGSAMCDEKTRLPCFLQLSSMILPRPDGSNMQCPVIVRKTRDAALQDCQGPAASQLGPEFEQLPVVDPESQLWNIHPRYYQFQGCSCLGGYQAAWNTDNSLLTCEPELAGVPTWVIAIAAVLVAAGVMLLAAFLLLVWVSMAVHLKHKWQRKRDLLEYTQKGMPTGGSATIVVTDVEGYPGLMQTNASAATRALKIYKFVLEKAATANAGHVIKQGGTSWSLAFHRPVDAVAFCLQVQQALQKTQWPSELGQMMPSQSTQGQATHTPAYVSAASGYSAVVEVSDMRQAPANRSINVCSPVTAEALEGKHHRQHSAEVSQEGPIQLVESDCGSHTSKACLAKGFGQLLTKWMTGNKVADDNVVERGSSRTQADRHPRTRRASWLGLSINSQTTGTAPASRIASAVYNWALSRTGKDDGLMPGADVINGLKVRIGAASGWVRTGLDIVDSDLMGLASVISNMANGGQILLDSCTALAVNELMTELGGVDHNGYNDKLLSMAYQGVFKKQASAALRFMGCFGATSRSQQQDTEPLLLSMGQCWVPSISKLAGKIAAQTHCSQQQPSSDDILLDRVTTAATSVISNPDDSLSNIIASPSHMLSSGSKAAHVAAAVAVLYGAAASDTVNKQGLQLYSILPRVHHRRCRVWRDSIKLTEGTQRMIKGFFDAPCTLVADLGPTSAFTDIERPFMPSVTMVFASVADGKAVVQANEAVAAYVHNVLRWVMQASLLCFPDGYLCREQEAVLKYMLAFSEPSKAAEWCLLVQELLTHLPWPSEVLAALSLQQAPAPKAGDSAQAAGSGKRVFGLKMGLADGIPDSMTPDHLGRADYFGASVNLAARIMDAAADAGQVVMSCELADAVFTKWRYMTLQGTQGCDTGKQEQAQEGTACQPQSMNKPGTDTEGSEQPTGGESQADSTLRQPAALQFTDMQQKATTEAVKAGVLLSTPLRGVRVTAYNIGTYAFKGCGALDMVTLTSDVMPPQEANRNQHLRSAKGTLIWQCSGPVVGLQDCPAMLPDLLPDLQKAWQTLEGIVPMHTGLTLGGVKTTGSRQPGRRSTDRITRSPGVTADN